MQQEETIYVSPIRVYVNVTDSKAQTKIDQLNTRVVITTAETWAADILDRVITGHAYGVEVLEYETVLVTKMVTGGDGIIHPEARIYAVSQLMSAANRSYGDDFDKYRTCASEGN